MSNLDASSAVGKDRTGMQLLNDVTIIANNATPFGLDDCDFSLTSTDVFGKIGNIAALAGGRGSNNIKLFGRLNKCHVY